MPPSDGDPCAVLSYDQAQSVRHVGRVEWLDVVAHLAASGRFGRRHVYVTLAHVFTAGHVDYKTGEGTKHQALSYIAGRAGVERKSVVYFLRDFKQAGLLTEIPGREKVIGPGQATALYRLTVPIESD